MTTDRDSLQKQMGLLVHEMFVKDQAITDANQVTMTLTHRKSGVSVEVPMFATNMRWTGDHMAPNSANLKLTDGGLISVTMDFSVECTSTSKEVLAKDITEMSEIEAAELHGYLAKMREKS